MEIYPVDNIIQPSNNQDQMRNKFAPPFENFLESFNSFCESKWCFLLKLSYVSINIQFHS